VSFGSGKDLIAAS